MPPCIMCNEIETATGLVKEYEFWTVFVSRAQDNIGTCIIALKSHSQQTVRVVEPEWSELLKTVRALERAMYDNLDATSVDWKMSTWADDTNSALRSHISLTVRPHFHSATEHAVRNRLEANAGPYPGFSTAEHRDEIAAALAAKL